MARNPRTARGSCRPAPARGGPVVAWLPLSDVLCRGPAGLGGADLHETLHEAGDSGGSGPGVPYVPPGIRDHLAVAARDADEDRTVRPHGRMGEGLPDQLGAQFVRQVGPVGPELDDD